MTEKGDSAHNPPEKGKARESDSRRGRLADALRLNLGRRKLQARARAGQEQEGEPGDGRETGSA